MFSTNSYREILSKLLSAGLVPSTDWGEEIGSTTLLLRHDVDFSITYAHELANLEQQAGITSTFFFMLTSNMYNTLNLLP